MTASAPSALVGGEAAAGLVHYSTTPTLEIEALRQRFFRMRRSVRWTAGVFEYLGQGRPAMVTLTYRPGEQWEREHISDFLAAAREFMRRRGHRLRFVWVAELQERGAVHFHVLLWLPRGVTLPKPDKRGWWPHGSTQIEWARKAVSYLCKYASKFSGPEARFPKGLRIHGSGGLDAEPRLHRTWQFLPGWLRKDVTPQHRMRPAAGGGWVSRLTGEFFESPFEVCAVFLRLGVGPVIRVRRKMESQPC